MFITEFFRILRQGVVEEDSILPQILEKIVIEGISINDVESILRDRGSIIKAELPSICRAVRRISSVHNPTVQLLWARIPETDSDTPVVLASSSGEERYLTIPLEDLKIPGFVKDRAVRMIAEDNFYLLTDGDLLEPREP